jgi:hypothetical protein
MEEHFTSISSALPKAAIVCALAAIVAACATVNPEPIDPNDRTKPGLRFYETRPFVLVQKPFPIWAKSILVDAQLSDDGKNAKILGSIPQDFIKSFPVAGKDLSTQAIVVTPGGAPGSKVNAQDAETVVGGSKSAAGSTAGQAATGDATPAPPANKPGSGSISLQVDKDGTPLLPINDLFSIVFLPDYNKAYVVPIKTWFGFAKIQIKTSPGGGLLAFNGEVDNSAVVKPLLDVYTTLVKAGGSALQAAISPHAAAANALAGSASAQSGETVVGATAPKLTPGSIVTLRLTLIRFATPGPHLILKPGEHPSKIDPATGEIAENTAVVSGPYEIDYRYFEVPIAEALLDAPSALSIVAATGGKGGETDKGKTASCASKKMLAVSAATTPNVSTIIKTDGLTVSTTAVKSADADNCVTELDVSAKLAASPDAFKDPDGSVGKKFTDKYPNTKLVFN